MFIRIPAFSFLIFTSFAFAQLDSNSVTVTSSKITNLQPDQAVFAVAVDSDINTTINDVVAAVQPAGITLANFAGVSTLPVYTIQAFPVPPPNLEWVFRVTVPLSKTKDTVATLTALQQSLQKNPGLRLSFTVQGTQVSQPSLQSQPCTISDLITDARAQAQKLADAAGRTVAGILAMSSSVSNAVGGCVVTIKFGLLGS